MAYVRHVSRSGFSFLLLLLHSSQVLAASQPLALHPDNPHYFLFRGKPAVLITSAEHYGAVLNLDFNYVKYLDELKANKLNLTRTFTGAYVEPSGAFNIASNTLAPAAHRFVSPWARSSTPGYANGGNKFDLRQWDPAYFKRLKDFLNQAARRGIVVELNLFCPFYEESQWSLSPQNLSNNINGLGAVARTNVYTLDQHGGLLEIHEALVRKLVTELKEFDNLYYEICNEPYFGGVTVEWQHRMVDVIVETEKALKTKHLISMNIANGAAKVQNPHPDVSIFNFHYASPPATVPLNYNFNKVIGDNETGFRGTNDLPYRVEAWDFIISGGGLYNHLDYSFAVGHEDGTFVYPATQPGGGNPAFRLQMKILREFIESFNFVQMIPDSSVIKKGIPVGRTGRALMDPGKEYAIYISPNPVPKDQFSVRWIGRVEPRFSEAYTFHVVSNDGNRLWLNARPLMQNWTAHSEREDSATIDLKAGQRYDLRVEYFQNGGGASMRLSWSSPSQTKEIIPESQLFLPDGKTHGLQARYYVGTNFERLQLARTDPAVDFDWTDTSPFADSAHTVRTNQVAELSLDIPAGSYSAQWFNTITGNIDKQEKFKHAVGPKLLVSPSFADDIALRVSREK